MRLKFLSQQPDILLDSPYFEAQPGFNNLEDSKSHSFDKKNDRASVSPSFFISPIAQSSSPEQRNSPSTPSENNAPEAPSPSSGTINLGNSLIRVIQEDFSA